VTRPLRPDWAIALHAGAGVIPKEVGQDKKESYLASLDEALRLGRDLLAQGTAGLDVVEQVVRLLEDTPHFNAGKGAVFTHDGRHELDAAVMDGRTLGCGSVAGVTTVKNPITLARHVMEDSPHVFLAGAGAEEFADRMGVERVGHDYFFTRHRFEELQDALAKEKAGVGTEQYGTVGCAVLDRAGNLAAGTSTGGLTAKRFGRVSDTAVIGAGTWADNKTAAVSCTGHGEQFIRHAVAHDVCALIEYRRLSVREAAGIVIHEKLDPGDGGLIAVARDGSIALVFNSEGMYRGAADSAGRFEVGIWE